MKTIEIVTRIKTLPKWAQEYIGILEASCIALNQELAYHIVKRNTFKEKENVLDLKRRKSDN